MTPDDLHRSFDAQLAELPGSSAVRAARQLALGEFLDRGFPSRKTESWRYTSIAPIADGHFNLTPPIAATDEGTIDGLLRTAGLTDEDAAMLFVDGSLAADRTATWRAKSQFELLELSASLDRSDTATVASQLHDYPLAALNVAFARNGVHLRAPQRAAATAPLHLVLANVSAAPHAVQPQLVIDLAAGASATVVLHLLDMGSAANWVNLLLRVTLAEGAQLEIQRMQRYGQATLHTELSSVTLAKDAHLRSTSVDIGGRLVRNDLRVTLEGPGASCDLAGLTAAGEGQHLDNHITVDHVASHSQSTQQYRAIVGARGRAVFNGKVIVREATAGIVAMQASDNLLLDDSGEVDTKPELEIYTDDVKCSHGATVGEIDDAELFYLRTRGIDEVTARGLLTLGFAQRTLERLPTGIARSAIAAKFGLAVPSDELWNPSL